MQNYNFLNKFLHNSKTLHKPSFLMVDNVKYVDNLFANGKYTSDKAGRVRRFDAPNNIGSVKTKPYFSNYLFLSFRVI